MSTLETLDRMELCESLLTWVSDRISAVFQADLADGEVASTRASRLLAGC